MPSSTEANLVLPESQSLSMGKSDQESILGARATYNGFAGIRTPSVHSLLTALNSEDLVIWLQRVALLKIYKLKILTELLKGR